MCPLSLITISDLSFTTPGARTRVSAISAVDRSRWANPLLCASQHPPISLLPRETPERRWWHVTHPSTCGSKNTPSSCKLPSLHAQDVDWIDGETHRPNNHQLSPGGPAHPSWARLRVRIGRAASNSLVFEREALRASASLLCRLLPSPISQCIGQILVYHLTQM